MIYESNFGVISRSLLPEETISWSVPDIISTKEIIEHAMITSPWFSYHGDLWCLALTSRTSRRTFIKDRPNCREINHDEYCLLGLFLWQKHPGKIQYDKITLTMNNEGTFPYGFTGEISGSLDSLGRFGRYDFLKINMYGSLMEVISPRGRMNFTCKIKKQQITKQIMKTSGTEVYEESSNENNNDEVSELKGTDRLIENLKTLCLDGRHSDFVLRVDGREFRVHKGILGARSPVFAAMFEHDMAETKEDNADIPDCVASAFEIFLLYLYTGYEENLSQDNIFDVYYAADKYRVDDLKAECLEFMKSTLSVNSFCDVIALSVRHNEKELLKKATCFFAENIKEIIKTVNWQKFLTENPIQANELLIKALHN